MPTRVSVRLEAPDDIVLNLQDGLSSHIYFCLRNDEDKAVTLTIPGFHQSKVTKTYMARRFDFMVALAQGIFQFREICDGPSISLFDKSEPADTEAPQPTHLVISPGATAKYVLIPRGSRQICHIGLEAWESYDLEFNDPSGKTKCKFSTFEEETYFEEHKEIPTATLHSDDQGHSAFFESTGRPIRIQVVPGIPMPRFQLSFQLSSNICNLSGSSSFFLRLTLKSLEPRPVILCMQQQPWFGVQELDDVFSLFDATTDEEIELPQIQWCIDGGEPKPLNRPKPVNFYLCFEAPEQTYEHQFAIDKSDLECLKPDRSYKMKLRDVGFRWWRYGTAGDKQTIFIDEHADGPIIPEIVEATPTFASVVEKTIGAGGRGPFSRLPRELKEMIYKYLEATEPKVLYFRTEARP